MKKNLLTLILIGIMFIPMMVSAGSTIKTNDGKVCNTHYNEYWFALGAGLDRAIDDSDGDNSDGIQFTDYNGTNDSGIAKVEFKNTIPSGAVIVKNNGEFGIDITNDFSTEELKSTWFSDIFCYRNDTNCDNSYTSDIKYANKFFFVEETFDSTGETYSYKNLNEINQDELFEDVKNAIRESESQNINVEKSGTTLKFLITREIDISSKDVERMKSNLAGLYMFGYYDKINLRNDIPSTKKVLNYTAGVVNGTIDSTWKNRLFIYPTVYQIEYYDPDTDCETTSTEPTPDVTPDDKEEETKQTYTITYSANGGKNEPSLQTKEEGKTINISKQEPTRDGYTFLGWSENQKAKEADSKYAPGSAYSEDENLILYAVWTPKSGLGYSIGIISAIIVLTGVGVWYFGKRNKFQNI